MEHISSQLVQHGACISHSAFCLCHGSPGLIVPEHHYELYWSKQSCHNETCIESSWPKDAHVLDCTDHNNVTNSDVFLPNFVSVVKQRQGQQCKTYTILYGLMYIYKYVRCFTLQNRQKLLGILSARWVVSNIFYFQPYLGDDFQFDQYFLNGLETTNQSGVFLPVFHRGNTEVVNTLLVPGWVLSAVDVGKLVTNGPETLRICA